MPIINPQTGKPISMDFQSSGTRATGVQLVQKVNATLNLQALRDVCAAYVVIGLARGLDRTRANGVCVALQYDLLSAMQDGIPQIVKAPQWYWDLRYAVLPKTARTKLGSFAYSFDVDSIAPIGGNQGGVMLGAPTTTPQNGLEVLTALNAPANLTESKSWLDEFFSYMATQAQPLVAYEKADKKSASDYSAYAYKVARVLSPGTEHTCSNVPLHSVACLEVPITSMYGMIGLSLIATDRWSRYVKTCDGTGPAAITIKYLLGEQKVSPPPWAAFSFRTIDLSQIIAVQFAQIEKAKDQYAASGRTDFPIPTGADGIALVLYFLGSYYNMKGDELAATVNLDTGVDTAWVGTNSFDPNQYTKNYLPGFMIEAFRSLSISYFTGNHFAVPQPYVTTDLIEQLSTLYPSYNWTNWGGDALNLYTSTISGNPVSLMPYDTGTLGSAFSVIRDYFSSLQTQLVASPTFGVHTFSLLGYIRELQNVTESNFENVVSNLARMSKGYKDEHAARIAIAKMVNSAVAKHKKRLKHCMTDPIEGEYHSGTLLDVGQVQGNIYSTVGFPTTWYFDQNFPLAIVPPGTYTELQIYTYNNCIGLLNGRSSGQPYTTELASSSYSAIRDSNNSKGGEILSRMDQMGERNMGNTAQAIFGEKGKELDNMVNSLGPVVKGVNWVVGKIVTLIKERRARRQARIAAQ